MFSLPTKILGGLGVIAVVLMLFGVVTKSYYNKGWYAGQDALQGSIEKRNQEAARHAQEARNEMDKCYDADRDWDQSRGVCLDKRQKGSHN